MQHAGPPRAERRCVPRLEPFACGLDANQPRRVFEQRVEEPHRVRAAADAGDGDGRQPPLGLEELVARLGADHRLEVAHHHRVGVRADDRAEQVVGRADVRDPVANRLVDGVLEGARARVHRPHLGAEQLHPEDVERLPAHVLGAHVDDAVEAEQRARRRRRDAVLAGAGLGDDALLAHALREQRLRERGVDLVCPGVREVLALEVDPRCAVAAKPLLKPLDARHRRWAPHVCL